MRKMHLVAIVPNEGARLLARWIGSAVRGDVDAAEQVLGIAADKLDRLLDGSLEPGDELREPLFFRAGIGRGVFSRPARCGWFGTPDESRSDRVAA